MGFASTSRCLDCLLIFLLFILLLYFACTYVEGTRVLQFRVPFKSASSGQVPAEDFFLRSEFATFLFCVCVSVLCILVFATLVSSLLLYFCECSIFILRVLCVCGFASLLCRLPQSGTINTAFQYRQSFLPVNNKYLKSDSMII